MPPYGATMPFLGLGSEAGLRTLADALPDALFTTDAEGSVTFWNKAAERITGWSAEEAVGKNCSLLAGDAVNGCSCGVGPLRCSVALYGRSSKQCVTRTRDGRDIVIVKNAVPIYGTDGRAVGALETFTEVAAAGRASPAAAGPGDGEGLLGDSPAMAELRRMIGLVAGADATVMILGESGSGKERVAEAIHRASARRDGPFVRVSCSALNENLLESELFGHVRGAFTGALRDRRGRFQEAHGGTLLLDEIGDVSPVVQVKLLRVIEQREIERVGDSQPIKVDVRLLCATHRDLKKAVAEGRFRADLYFRLAVFPLRVPALRERPDDVPVLAQRFLERLDRGARERGRSLRPDAVARLLAYPWPGNVRELQNVVEYAALRAGGADVGAEHLPPDVLETAAAPPLRPVAGGPAGAGGAVAGPPADERAGLERALEAHGWNRTRTAQALGISRVTLWKRIRRLGLAAPDEAEAADGDAG